MRLLCKTVLQTNLRAGALSGLQQRANRRPDKRSASGIVDCGYCVKPFCRQICALAPYPAWGSVQIVGLISAAHQA
ncbi:hypothetical protein BED30_13905 [Citrobacter portucalensis]|nr:hypothetical protein BED30_13905 [Citrobacter portucalensis]